MKANSHDHFVSIFTSSYPSDADIVALTSKVLQLVSDEVNVDFIRPFTPIKVKNALFSMHTNKSPSTNNFSPCFYQHQ